GSLAMASKFAGIFCKRTFDVGVCDRVLGRDRSVRRRRQSVERVTVEHPGRIQSALTLKCSHGFSVIVAVTTVDHTGRKTSTVEQSFGFNDKRRIVLLALPDLRLYNRRSSQWLPRRMPRMVWRGADAEGGANQEPQ